MSDSGRAVVACAAVVVGVSLIASQKTALASWIRNVYGRARGSTHCAGNDNDDDATSDANATPRTRKSCSYSIRTLMQYSAPEAYRKALSYIPHWRVRLCNIPTPLHTWAPFECDDVTLWVKRDDDTGCTLGGNKVRKLEFLLAEAVSGGYESVITAGGIQSNHARATAVAARLMGLRPILGLRVKDSQTLYDPGLCGNLLLSRMVGAGITLVAESHYERVGSPQVLCELADAEESIGGKRPYIIPVGGSNALGTWGYLECVQEIKTQMLELGVDFDEIAVPVGSGATAAGVALGVSLSGMRARVRGYCVCDTPELFYREMDTILQTLGSHTSSRSLIELYDCMGEGYAQNTVGELQGIAEVSQRTGVILDPVYSGKAFLAWKKQLLSEQALRATGERTNALFIHTGGIFGVFGVADELQTLEILPKVGGTVPREPAGRPFEQSKRSSSVDTTGSAASASEKHWTQTTARDLVENYINDSPYRKVTKKQQE